MASPLNFNTQNIIIATGTATYNSTNNNDGGNANNNNNVIAFANVIGISFFRLFYFLCNH